MNLKQLKEPIALKWRLSNKIGKDKGMFVAYIDARDVMDKLDAVCEPQNWQSTFHAQAGKLFCEISIQTAPGVWVGKQDAGSDTQIEADKGAASSAFKRAANMWGIGRFTYATDNQILNFVDYKGKQYPADDKGKVLWNVELVSNYINGMLNKGGEL